jgi:hypothetical protein
LISISTISISRPFFISMNFELHKGHEKTY